MKNYDTIANTGWVKFPRSFLEHPIFTSGDIHLLRLALYIWLKVNHKEKKVIFAGKEMVIPPGSGLFGLNQIVRGLTGLRKVKLRRFKRHRILLYRRLKKLQQKLGFLKLKPYNKFTVISLVNWGKDEEKNEKCNTKSNKSVTPEAKKRNSSPEKRAENVNKQEVKNVKNIIIYLNMKTGKRFSAENKVTQRLIRTRFNEGYSLEDLRMVIDSRVRRWQKDEKMVEYLRPWTLFNASKFEGYLVEAKKEQEQRSKLEEGKEAGIEAEQRIVEMEQKKLMEMVQASPELQAIRERLIKNKSIETLVKTISGKKAMSDAKSQNTKTDR